MGNTPRGDSDAEAGAVVQLPQLTNAALNVPNTRDDHVLVLHTSGSTGKKKQVRPRAGAAYLRLHRQEEAGAATCWCCIPPAPPARKSRCEAHSSGFSNCDAPATNPPQKHMFRARLGFRTLFSNRPLTLITILVQVPYTLSNMVVGSLLIAKSRGLYQGMTCLSMLPLFHIAGVSRNLAPLLLESCIIFSGPFNPALFWEILDTQTVHYYAATPTMHQARAGHPIETL
jgi:acyl-CoA synthetase (AMP-forming)/AMP-acid ligase II